MDYKELKRNISKAGLTIKEFAELLDMHPNSVTNLKQKDKVPNHLAIIISLIVELEKNDINYSDLVEKWKRYKDEN